MLNCNSQFRRDSVTDADIHLAVRVAIHGPSENLSPAIKLPDSKPKEFRFASPLVVRDSESFVADLRANPSKGVDVAEP
jgi:hypothetical protein